METSYLHLSTLFFGGAVFAMLASAAMKRLPHLMRDLRTYLKEAVVSFGIL